MCRRHGVSTPEDPYLIWHEAGRATPINHFPLRQSHAVLPRIPRFVLWCGTRRTDDWHVRFRARAVIYGHLHIPRTHEEAGVVFQEVSLGYPRQRRFRPLEPLRTVLVAEDG